MKSRAVRSATKQIATMDAAISRFGRSLTHRLETETLDDNGRVTAVSTTDTTFVGDLQASPRQNRALIQLGVLDIGDAVLYVSASQTTASTIVPHRSVVIEGTTAGEHASWEVAELLNIWDVENGTPTHYEFKLVKRTPVTLT